MIAGTGWQSIAEKTDRGTEEFPVLQHAGPGSRDTIVLPALEALGGAAVAKEAGVNRQDIWNYRTRRRRPRPERGAVVTAAVAIIARRLLVQSGFRLPKDDLGDVALWLKRQGSTGRPD